MYVKFQGTVTGDTTSGDVITKIEFACRTGAETGDNAAAKKSYEVGVGGCTQGEVDAIITAFEGGGFMANVGSLTSGATYTPCAKVTESRTGGATGSVGWVDCAGSGTYQIPYPFTQTVLDAPTIGTATASTKTLTWSAPTGSPSGYKIYVSSDSGSTYPVIYITGNVTSWVLPTMTASTNRYKVTAINSYGVESAQSAVATAA